MNVPATSTTGASSTTTVSYLAALRVERAHVAETLGDGDRLNDIDDEIRRAALAAGGVVEVATVSAPERAAPARKARR